MWINTLTKKVYQLHSEIRSAFPQTSFPRVLTDEVISGFDILPVVKTEKPTPGPTKNVAEGAPVHIDGEWRQTWNVSDATDQEIAEKSDAESAVARAKRDSLLADSDWTQVADAPVDAAAWAVYRQALRDITGLTSWPHLTADDWPDSP